MNTEYRYTFEKGSKKYLCPDCSKKTLVRYIDTLTGENIPDKYGRCDRESKCSYNCNPYLDGYSKMIWKQEQGENVDNWKPISQQKTVKPIVKKYAFDSETFKRTLSGYEVNTFIQNLLKNIDFPFELADVENVISMYYLGTIQNGYRTGAITFPFIDVNNVVRTIQVKQFDKFNHTTGTDFLHSIITKHYTKKNQSLPLWLSNYNTNEIKVSCLFGEHLLSKYPNNPIALVEAPKTAIYGTLYFGLPKRSNQLIWLAVYNLSSLNVEKCKALKGRNVHLFPDLSEDGKAFDLWSNKAKEIYSQLQGTSIKVSNLLEQLAPEEDKTKGKDLADYLIQLDWRLFRKQNKEPENNLQPPEPIKNVVSVKSAKSEAVKTNILFVKKESLNWDRDILNLETYFESIELPKEPIQLNKGSTITNVGLFIDSHFKTIKANNGNKTFLPYLSHLNQLKQVLSTNTV